MTMRIETILRKLKNQVKKPNLKCLANTAFANQPFMAFD